MCKCSEIQLNENTWYKTTCEECLEEIKKQMEELEVETAPGG